jgi:hypothetical protein
MKLKAILGLAGLSLAATAGAQPALAWSVADQNPDRVLLVSEATGSGDVARAGVLTVFAKPHDGADRTFAYWTIDCGTEMVLDEGATRFLGGQEIGKSASVTPGGPRVAALGTVEKAIYEFVCIGPLANADSTPLPTTDAAIAHAGELLARWESAGR